MKRLEKIMDSGKKAVIVPMDHGVSEGPIAGLVDMNAIVSKVEKHATAVLLHKGIIKSLKRRPSCGLIMHASAGTKVSPDPNRKVLIATPLEAKTLGCDAFSIHVNIGGSEHEAEMLDHLGKCARECDEIGMPFLAMMYARGKNIVKASADEIALVARIGGELGADIVKCPYTGDVESFKKVVRGCPVPVVIAGGPKANNDKEVLEMISGSMQAGAAGVSLGRNIFQHDTPEKMTLAIRRIVIDNRTVDEALEELIV